MKICWPPHTHRHTRSERRADYVSQFTHTHTPTPVCATIVAVHNSLSSFSLWHLPNPLENACKCWYWLNLHSTHKKKKTEVAIEAGSSECGGAGEEATNRQLALKIKSFSGLTRSGTCMERAGYFISLPSPSRSLCPSCSTSMSATYDSLLPFGRPLSPYPFSSFNLPFPFPASIS